MRQAQSEDAVAASSTAVSILVYRIPLCHKQEVMLQHFRSKAGTVLVKEPNTNRNKSKRALQSIFLVLLLEIKLNYVFTQITNNIYDVAP